MAVKSREEKKRIFIIAEIIADHWISQGCAHDADLRDLADAFAFYHIAKDKERRKRKLKGKGNKRDRDKVTGRFLKVS